MSDETTEMEMRVAWAVCSSLKGGDDACLCSIGSGMDIGACPAMVRVAREAIHALRNPPEEFIADIAGLFASPQKHLDAVWNTFIYKVSPTQAP